ncbi:MAG TPA: YeeE/YedE family protein [Rhodocyclaceae bacterium]|nr:YeeE/YedE family protein [Rhodocyclaceae bacterium]HRQ47818.1 YeeE/YedE family protein [Rhodocyclaceae bacterium]
MVDQTGMAAVVSERSPAVHKGARYAAAIVGAVAVGSVLAIAADTRWTYLLVYVWFGLVYGLFLQYGRFCMASAVRDLFAVGVPRMAVGVLIAVALYSLTAAAVTVAGFSTFHPNAMGWHVLIGGAIFGFGIIFTGGCASSSLYKTGEGNLGALLVVVSISFSQAVMVAAGGWLNWFVPASWTESAIAKDMPEELAVTETWFDQFLAGHIWDLKSTTVAQMLGMQDPVIAAFVGNALLSAILPTAALLIALYYLAYRKGYLRRKGIQHAGLREDVRGIWSMFTSSRNTAIAGLGLGIFAGLQMWVTGALREHYRIFNFGELLADMGYTEGLSLQYTVFDPGYWYITTQEAQWGGWVLNKLGVENMNNIFFGLDNGLPNPLINAPGFMSIGIILGAAVLALTRREFKWKVPSLETATFAIVGGILMGIGARIAMGCNIGAFFATVTNGDLSGWVFLVGMAAGGYVGVRLFNWWIEWRASRNDELAL